MESQGQTYNIGEKLTVTLYTYTNQHVGTPRQKQTIVIIQFFGPLLSELEQE